MVEATGNSQEGGKMTAYIGFIVGFLCGGFCGLLVAALCVAAKRADEECLFRDPGGLDDEGM